LKARIVFFKELTEMLRDRRVLFGALVMPLLLILLMMKMFSLIESSVTGGEATKIAIVKGGESSSLGKALSAVPKATIKLPKTVGEAKKLLADGTVRLALVIEPGFDAQMASGHAKVQAYYNSSEPLSGLALRIIEEAVSATNKAAATAKIKEKGLPASVLDPISLGKSDTAKPEAKGAEMLLSLLPYMIILWSFYGGFSSVSDMMAGEKERGTLETLLLSPVGRNDIAVGKLAALSLICLASALSAVLGVVLAGMVSKQGGMELKVSANSLAAIIAMVLPLVAMFSSLLFVVSTWAKNMRECQTYLTSVSFVVLIPAVLSNIIGFTGIDKAPWLKFVPILNVGAGLRQAFMGVPDWSLIGVALVVHLMIAAVCLRLTLRLINKDQVLVRI